MVVFGCPPTIVKLQSQLLKSLDVKQQVRIFVTAKSRMTNVSLLELMHKEQTNSSVVWKIEMSRFLICEYIYQEGEF
jgi:hypothetical protein